MNKIIEYISDLLLLHDCVIIPDFGGFICNYKCAYIDEESGLILPPSKEIVFNRSLKNNDGLLASWVASKENISYDRAVERVELFADELKVKLSQHQSVAFGDIGVFRTDRRLNIIFEGSDINFLADAFGMERIETKKPEKEVKKSQPEQINIPSTPEVPFSINMGESSNGLHRLSKYGLAVTAIAGVVFLSHFSYVHWDELNLGKKLVATAVQPALPQAPASAQPKNHHVDISPDYEYVDYDPLENQ